MAASRVEKPPPRRSYDRALCLEALAAPPAGLAPRNQFSVLPARSPRPRRARPTNGSDRGFARSNLSRYAFVSLISLISPTLVE